MSLQVWLPLISDVNSIGLNRNTVTPHNITYGSAKLGDGAILNGSNGYIEGSVYTTATMTYMCWVYFTTLRGCHLLDCRTPAGNGYQPMYINPTSGVQVGGSTSAFPYIAYTFAASTWYHIAVTYSATKCQLFVNGQFVGESTSGKGTAINDSRPFYIGCRCTQVNWTAAKINDFRIYDHTCSAKEIAEVARGLFLHYKLDDNYNNSAVADCSGYKHNGSSNNITVASNSPRYTQGSIFNGTSSYIKVLDNSWMAQGMEAFTVNLWAKASTWPTTARLFSCTESGGFNCEAGNSGYWRFPIRVYTDSGHTTTAYKYDSQEIQISALPTNEWVMITWTYNSAGTKTYINGELHHTYTNTSYGVYYNTSARLFIGCEANVANPTSPYFGGQMSDFRMYATALVDKQVKELYNESVAIAKDSGIFAREFVETTSISVKKNGQLTANSFQETGDTAYFKKNGTIKGSDIYEY